MNSVFKKIKQIIFAGILVAVLPGVWLYGMTSKSHVSEHFDESFEDDFVVFTEEEIEEIAKKKTQEDIEKIKSKAFDGLDKKDGEAILKLYKKNPIKFTQQIKEKIKEKIRKAIEEINYEDINKFYESVNLLDLNTHEQKEKKLEEERRKKLRKEITVFETGIFKKVPKGSLNGSSKVASKVSFKGSSR
ncbi:MAG: hypothetical protein ABH827_03145 [bacterium]